MATEVTAMNHHGARALAHWTAHLPAQLAQIQDHEAFFTLVGETAETEIEQLAEALADLKPEAEGYLNEVARLETAKKIAETEVTRDLILVDPANQEKIAELLQMT
jgi:hypothetical protein